MVATGRPSALREVRSLMQAVAVADMGSSQDSLISLAEMVALEVAAMGLRQASLQKQVQTIRVAAVAAEGKMT